MSLCTRRKTDGFEDHLLKSIPNSFLPHHNDHIDHLFSTQILFDMLVKYKAWCWWCKVISKIKAWFGLLYIPKLLELELPLNLKWFSKFRPKLELVVGQGTWEFYKNGFRKSGNQPWDKQILGTWCKGSWIRLPWPAKLASFGILLNQLDLLTVKMCSSNLMWSGDL